MRTYWKAGLIILAALLAVLAVIRAVRPQWLPWRQYIEYDGAQVDASRPDIDVELLTVNPWSRPGEETERIITLKDIFEALVGELPDPREEPDIVRRDDGSALVDGQCPFYDFLAAFGVEDDFPANAYNTVSGLILDLLGHIPETGEKIEWNAFSFEIVDMDGARIDKILVVFKPVPSEEDKEA